MKGFLRGRYIFLIITLFPLNSCNLFNSNEHLVGDFYLQNDNFGKTIRYRIDDNSSVEIYGDSFDCVAFDKKFIIIKRNESQYLIIEAYKGINLLPEKGILGPFTKNEFFDKKRLLNINANFACDVY